MMMTTDDNDQQTKPYRKVLNVSFLCFLLHRTSPSRSCQSVCRWLFDQCCVVVDYIRAAHHHRTAVIIIIGRNSRQAGREVIPTAIQKSHKMEDVVFPFHICCCCDCLIRSLTTQCPCLASPRRQCSTWRCTALLTNWSSTLNQHSNEYTTILMMMTTVTLYYTANTFEDFACSVRWSYWTKRFRNHHHHHHCSAFYTTTPRFAIFILFWKKKPGPLW